MKLLSYKYFGIAFIAMLLSAINFEATAQRIYRDTVYLQNYGEITLWDNTTAFLYSFTYNEKQPAFLPGKIIEVEEGDSVHIFSRSISNDGFHTIHLHGLDVNTINDGDPMTSFPLSPYSEFTYKFLATHAGTFIYHCHVGDVMHVQMGMYGLLIVKPKGSKKTAWTGGPSYNKTYSWLTSELDKFWHENTPYAMMNDFKIPVFKPDYFLVNGKSKQQLSDTSTAIVASTKEKVYLRLANIGFYKHQFIFPASLNAEVVDSDGRPLPKSFVADTVNITPGERYGVMLQSSNALLSFVKINFIDMFTQQIKGTEQVPINIVQNVGVDDKNNTKKMIGLSPNPAKERLSIHINAKGSKNYGIKIKDLFGRQLMELWCEGFESKDIDIASLPSGIYIAEVALDEYTISEKFIKE